MAAKYTGIEKYMFSDIYNFFLKYKDIPNEEYYWEICIKDANGLRFKYKDHPLARGMINLTMSQLEHKICNKPLDGLSHDEWEENLAIAKQSVFK